MRWIVFLVVGLACYGCLLGLAWCLCTAARRSDEAAERARLERWR